MSDDTTPPAPVKAGDADLRRCAVLAARFVETKQVVEELEAKLKAAKEAHRKIMEEELPDAMLQAGLSEFETLDGRQVSIKSVVSATWPSADKPEKVQAAVAFLAECEALDLISSDVVCSFSKKEHEEARRVYEQVRGNNKAIVTFVEKVHPQTLGSFVRERLKNGLRVDFDALNVNTINRATVR